MTAADLAQYVDARDERDTARVQTSWATATALVNAYVGAAAVPADVLQQVYVEVGAAIFRRKEAPGGATQFATFGDQGAVRISADPLAGVYPMLRPFLGPVVA
ncbi:hypothetical protein CH252_40615 [Rhodococcus sp. 06-1477-1B]|nr:hypothetical protein CH252_40615 [Rhodococcus sp. 06-1477-1B]